MKYKNFFLKKSELINIINVFKISINRVGVKNYYHPFIFDSKRGRLQKTIGLWNITSSLLKSKRGVHMSRFIYLLTKFLKKPLSLHSLFKVYNFFYKKILSNNFFIQVSFIYFLKKISLISKNNCNMNYKVTILLKRKSELLNLLVKIFVPVSSLCPCSKLISYFNAHNQRSFITILLILNNLENFIMDNIIKKIEILSSSSLWSVIKRNDEKFFTEFSYKNPNFIEDITRKLQFSFSMFKFILKIENLESIHNHDVYSFSKNF